MDQRRTQSQRGIGPAAPPASDLWKQGKEPIRVQFDIAPAALLKLFLAFIGIELFISAWPVLIVIGLAVMLAAAFNPMVRKLQARITRNWAVATVVIVLFAAILGLLALILPPILEQGLKLIQQAPEYTSKLQATLAKHHLHVNVQDQVQGLSSRLMNSVPRLLGLLSGAASAVAGAIGLFFLTVYLLIEGPRAGNSLLRLLPRERRLGARNLAAQLGSQVGGYIRGQIITSVLAGIFTFVALILIHVPYALALAALAAVADAVPVIGILMGLVPPALMALTISPYKAGLVILAYGFYHQLESQIISPRVYGNTMGLPLSVIVISFLVGLQVLGIVGAIVALPIAAAIPSIVNFIQQWQEERDVIGSSGRA